MKFNINKCHVLTVTTTDYLQLQLLMNELPFSTTIHKDGLRTFLTTENNSKNPRKQNTNNKKTNSKPK